MFTRTNSVTDSQLPNAQLSPAPVLVGKLLQGIHAVSTMVSRAILEFGRSFALAAEKADDQHRRAELLAAYRRRRSWKKSDRSHLESLGVNVIVRRRMERLTGKGRPVVRPHQPLGLSVITGLVALRPLFDPAGSHDERRRAFKLWPGWQHYVEALYRGESALARKEGIPGPAEHAERAVGKALGIASAKVHAICGDIRRLRNDRDGAANFPPVLLTEYERWMSTGIPRDD